MKIVSLPFQKINTLRSNYCAAVLWWFLYLHIVIMDPINCSWSSHSSFLFLCIFQIPIVTLPTSVWRIYLTALQQSRSFVLCKTLRRMRAAVEHPHCSLQADPRTGVSVYLYKALLAIAARLLLQGYHNLGLYLLLLLATKCPIVANW